MVLTQVRGLARPPSRRDLRRIHSEPTLAPLWEPTEGEEGADSPPWASPGASTSYVRHNSIPLAFNPQAPHAGTATGRLPTPWEAVLSRLSRSGALTLSAVAQQELVAAANESLRQKDALTLQLRSGKLDDHYMLKRELHAGAHYQVMEGISRTTQHNVSLKLVSRGAAARLKRAHASARLDPMQVLYLVSSFVDDVFASKRHVVLCMKWGSHEVDATHQLSCLVLNALDLLHELLPAADVPTPNLHLQRADLQRVLLRTMALDAFLQDHLYIE